MKESNEMNKSEKMALEWLFDQGFSKERIRRIDNERPDFILRTADGGKVYVEVTECGWLNSLGEDERGIHSDLKRIVADVLKSVREDGGLPEKCWIGVRLDWPYVFVPTERSVGGVNSKRMKKKIRERIQKYGEFLNTFGNSVEDSSASRLEIISLDEQSINAKLRFWKRSAGKKGDYVEIDTCEGNRGSLESSRYASTIRRSLRKKTTEDVKSRVGAFSEYWLVLTDGSSMLVGVDHEPDAEEWRRRDWDIARERVGQDPNSEYWDRIVVVSDCNVDFEHIEVLAQST